MRPDHIAERFKRLALGPDPDLTVAALTIARVEYRQLDVDTYVNQVDALGRQAAARVLAAHADPARTPAGHDPQAFARVLALNEFLFQEQQFVGNASHYDDPRNSCLNQVLDRRTGIPITLSVVYLEMARRAGIAAAGINFPGHFLVLCDSGSDAPGVIVDPFHGGALLTPAGCRDLLRRHTGDEAAWHPRLLATATTRQILTRMLGNLKRIYLRMHSLPQAREVLELLLAIEPDAAGELRDRGLVALKMSDFPAALRDLERYLEITAGVEQPESDRREHTEVWEQVKALRRQVAELN
jgi:regulator of sirC expression with transglutaminase-like and TPR domain